MLRTYKVGLHIAKVKITGPVSSTRPPVVTCDSESSRLRVCAAPRLPCPFAPSSVSCPFPALCCVINALLRQRLPPSSWAPGLRLVSGEEEVRRAGRRVFHSLSAQQWLPPPAHSKAPASLSPLPTWRSHSLSLRPQDRGGAAAAEVRAASSPPLRTLISLNAVSPGVRVKFSLLDCLAWGQFSCLKPGRCSL